ncbi:MAG: ABC transporter permease, partial [Saprospiraceae bacterium]
MLKNYIKIAWRNLLRNKISSFINIGGLAAGMAVVLLIALYVLDEYSYDRFHKNFPYIFRVVETQQQADGFHPVAVTPGPLAPALKTDFPEVAATARIGRWAGLLQYEEQSAESKDMLIVDKAIFQIFDFQFIKGNVKSSFDTPEEIIITETMATLFFGNDWQHKNILGQTLILNDFQKIPLKLVGVIKNLPGNSHLQANVLLPFKYLEKYDTPNTDKWNSNNYHTYLQLKPETNITSFEQKIANYLKKYDTGIAVTLQLQPLSKIYLQSKFDFQTDWGKRSDIFYVYLFTTIGFIILLIAVFNFINLATARATQRAREVGVRKVVGAQRYHLVYQFLGEALLTVSLSTLLALVIAELLLPILNELAGNQYIIPFTQAVFWIIILLFSIILTLFAGIYPAFILSSFRPVNVLRGFFAIRSGKLFRQSLVVGQFMLSIILVISTLVIYRQLLYMQHKKLGFEQEQLLYVKIKGDLKGKSYLLKEAFTNISGVMAVSATTNNLVNAINASTVEWEGKSAKENFLITQMNVDPDFLNTTGMKLVAGRNFSDAITSDTTDNQGVYLINVTAAQRMGWTAESALGKKVNFWGLDGNIIGVVNDFHFRPLHVPIEPFIFRYRPKEFYFTMLVKINPVNIQQTITKLAQTYHKYEANFPFEYG